MAGQTGTRVALYLRVSSEGQDSPDAYGLDVQESDCRRYAERHGLRIVSVHREAVTGRHGLTDRTALPEAVAAIDAGEADGLLTAGLDRIARALTTQEAILAGVWSTGGTVHTVRDGLVPEDDPADPMRTAMRQMAGVFAELDRALVVKRLADGRRAKRAIGGYGGGYRAEVHPTLDALALALHREGRSLRAVAAALQDAGHTPPRGGVWRHTTVQRMVQRAERAERGRQTARAA